MKKLILISLLLLSQNAISADPNNANVNPFSGKSLNLEDIQKDLELMKAYNQLQSEKAKALEAGGTLELLPLRLKIEKQKLSDQLPSEAPYIPPAPVYVPPVQPMNTYVPPPAPVYTPPVAPPVEIKLVVKKKPRITKPKKPVIPETSDVSSTINYKYSEKTGFMTFKNNTVETEIGKNINVSNKSYVKYPIAENVDEQKNIKSKTNINMGNSLPSLPLPPGFPQK